MIGVLAAALIASLCVVVYAYVGYPILLSVLAARGDARPPETPFLPLVTLVIPMHNEAAVIKEKVRNTRDLRYPNSHLEVILIDDGSTDGSSAQAHDVLPPDWRLITNQLRAGKPSIVNQAVDVARGEIVMLSDADTLLPPDGVAAMVRHFADARVGGVTGEVRMADMDGPGAAEAGYWRYENGIKDKQSRLGVVMGGSGGTVAFRRELYTALEPDCLVDEYVILLRIALAGHLVRAEPGAAAVHRATASIGTEFERRARIVCGGWQSIIRTGSEAARATGKAKFHYVSHRVLRWAVAPYLLIAAGVLMAILAPQVALARWLLLLAVAGLVVAAIGAVVVSAKWRAPAILLIPFMVVFLNAAAITGLIRYIRGSQSVRWARASSRPAPRARLSIEVEDGPTELRVRLVGELRGRGVDELCQAWPQWQQRRSRLWIDFGGVRRWDLRGLSTFVTLLGQAHDAALDIRLSGIPLEALNAANLAGLSPEIIVRDEAGRPLPSALEERVEAEQQVR
jgi:cellulose synthase/poly-beta-1,6-N-acetylglucosamine synthase-like glycosyltransferase/ABC-type transporter Mla MlaB component